MRFIIGALALVPLLAAAETAYITDMLKLGLHQAADTSDRAFRTLESGQAMEILSRDRNYAHVRLPDGVEGYVKARYLVSDRPAKLIVAETKAESDRVSRELEETRREFAGPAATINALEQQIADLQASIDESAATVTELREENEDFRGRQDQYKNSLPLRWVAGAIGVCLLGGFLGGLWWVDSRSRRRHGGIRIY